MSWLELATNFFDAARSMAGLAVNWLIQSTLLIVGGLVVGYLLRKRGSAVQSAVYRTTLAAVLACPLATWGLSLLGVSGWSLAMPAAYSVTSTIANNDLSVKPDSAPVDKTPINSGPAVDRAASVRNPPFAPRFQPLSGSARNHVRRDGKPQPDSIESAAPAVAETKPVNEPLLNVHRFGAFATAAGLLWLITGTWLLSRLAIAWVRLHRLRRGARPADATTIEVCQQIAAQLRVSPPDVLHSPYLPSPCLAGLRRPAVMLPETQLSLPVRDVLVHELAHLRRNDCFWNLIRRTATSVLFFQPLLWKLSHRLAATAEEVCDDYVVQFGGDRREYAHRLVDIATLSLAPFAAAGVGIVSLRSMLAARVLRIMDASRSLSTRVGNIVLAVVLIAGFAATLVVGLVGVERQPAMANAAEEQTTKLITTSGDVKNDRPYVKPAANADASSSPGSMQISGRITSAEHKPVAGANVALIGGHRQYRRGGDLSNINPVLAQTTTDANGNYKISAKGVSSKTFYSLEVIASADHAAVAWRELNPDESSVEASFELPPEQLIRGRLMDANSKPVANARLNITSIARPITKGDYPTERAWTDRESALPKAWPAPLITDREGRFVVRNVAANHGVFIEIDGNDQIAPQEIAINSGMKEQRPKNDGTFRPLVKNVKPNDEAVFALVPARIFEGTVTYDDTGKPAAGTQLLVWADQGHGSSSAVPVVEANTEGRFKLRPYSGESFRVEAHPPESSGYLAKELPTIEWKDAATRKQVDIKLNRGVLVHGSVIESATNKPVPGASIQYYEEQENNPNIGHGALAGYEASELSDNTGQFQITVLPGPGRLIVHAPSGDFVVKESSAAEITSGTPGGERYYAHAFERINPPANSRTLNAIVKLERSKKVVGRLVDEQGRPVKDAMIISKLAIHPFSLSWEPSSSPQTHDGVFELSGFAPSREYDVYFLDTTHRLGASAKLRADDVSPTITLKPCGQAVARFKYRDGTPIVNYTPLPEFVMSGGVSRSGMLGSITKKMGVPGAEVDYVTNIDHTNWRPGPATDKNGQITFPALIPGATYRFRDTNQRDLSAKLFSVQPGQTVDLGEFVFDKVNE